MLKDIDIELENRIRGDAAAADLMQWAHQRFGSGLVMSTSFGIYSAAMLHLAVQIVPRIPVIWIDTGYLPPETYRYAEDLTRRLNLNLSVHQSQMSPARMEALMGRFWEAPTLAAANRYDHLRKVEPMRDALNNLNATAWVSGIRADQTTYRKTLPRIALHETRIKLHPFLHWGARDVHGYLKRHGVPNHPLFDQGYMTVGDWHSSAPVTALGDVRATRFHGLKQECGLHLPAT